MTSRVSIPELLWLKSNGTTIRLYQMELKFPKNAVGLDVIVVLNPLLNKSELDLDKANVLCMIEDEWANDPFRTFMFYLFRVLISDM